MLPFDYACVGEPMNHGKVLPLAVLQQVFRYVRLTLLPLCGATGANLALLSPHHVCDADVQFLSCHSAGWQIWLAWQTLADFASKDFFHVHRGENSEDEKCWHSVNSLLEDVANQSD